VTVAGPRGLTDPPVGSALLGPTDSVGEIDGLTESVGDADPLGEADSLGEVLADGESLGVTDGSTGSVGW
jgi:hypothetical protein